ncbi:hypothetical protein SAMN05880582_10725 [Rhizobium sp. RU20A]|uniref:DUF6176 family protein n=1 Tax=Rhizobium sp. RU20A TaxID=1907412 RepID=UPI0009550353|nr:DUF6176 family protein [Rhizobium sp. RU20A]SIR14923.1 hypothetical protein SAMN05880582_10725 [Rhizobium sp. RU20A]
MNYRAKKIRLLCTIEIVEQWAAFMRAHLPEVEAALRQEGVHHEMWFSGTDDRGLFVIGVMDVDDQPASAAVSAQSQLSVDAVHRQFKSHWDRSSIQDIAMSPQETPHFEGCVLLFEARGQ